MSEPFGVRLRTQMERRGPLCVGIDPSPALLTAWGLDDSPAGLERFSFTVAEAVADVAAAVKPQSAFFERWGSRGVAVLERLIPALREAGALVVLDAKRGDIASTMAGYAEAYLEQGSPMAVDAMTVSPYLGFGSLAGTIATAHANDAGLFVLARTSNPEAALLQETVATRSSKGWPRPTRARPASAPWEWSSARRWTRSAIPSTAWAAPSCRRASAPRAPPPPRWPGSSPGYGTRSCPQCRGPCWATPRGSGA